MPKRTLRRGRTSTTNPVRSRRGRLSLNKLKSQLRSSQRRVRAWPLWAQLLATATVCGTIFGAANGGLALWDRISVAVSAEPIVLHCLSAPESDRDLSSIKLSGNRVLEGAYDNCPPLQRGKTCDAVDKEDCKAAIRLVQEILVANGFKLPKSTRSDGTLDGVFGDETEKRVEDFQVRYKLRKDGKGVIGRQTLAKLDALARQSESATPISS